GACHTTEPLEDRAGEDIDPRDNEGDGTVDARVPWIDGVTPAAVVAFPSPGVRTVELRVARIQAAVTGARTAVQPEAPRPAPHEVGVDAMPGAPALLHERLHLRARRGLRVRARVESRDSVPSAARQARILGRDI